MELTREILEMEAPPATKQERLTLLMSHLSDNLLGMIDNPIAKVMISQLNLEERLQDSFLHLQESNVDAIIEHIEEVIHFVKSGSSTDAQE